MQPENNVAQVQDQGQQVPSLTEQAKDSPQVQNITQQTQEPQPDIKSEENKKNWAEFRATREAERKAREEAERRAHEKAAEAEALKAALEAALKPIQNQYQQQPQFQQQDLYGYGQQQPQESDDARIQRKVEEALQKRYALEEQKRKEREALEMPQKLQSTYNDFNKVCTPENLDYLEYHHPEIARGYALAPESFDKWAGIYQAIKKHIPNNNNNRDAIRANQNLSKPQSLSRPGAASGGHAMPEAHLTEERKAANYARMQAIMNQVD